MGDNTLGIIYKVTSFGESHGKLIGAIIDGIPAGLKIDLDFIQNELNLRKPGQSSISSPRKEFDEVKVLSGVFNGFTTGAPLCLIIKNKAIESSVYEKSRELLRPSHIDYTALKKYGGFADFRGSGRFSGRVTASFVMAGALAKQILKIYGINIFAYTKSIGKVIDNESYKIDAFEEMLSRREKSLVRSLDSELSKQMEKEIMNAKEKNDSVGGTVKTIILNFPPGIGGPIFNSIESNLSKAIFSIPSVKGIEFGVGFKAAEMKGSEHNDPWILVDNKIKTLKNDSGGIIGGISTGMPIEFTVAIKPTSSIGIPQKTVNIATMREDIIKIQGKHDPCIVPRAIVVVEAMTAMVLIDYMLKAGRIPSIINA